MEAGRELDALVAEKVMGLMRFQTSEGRTNWRGEKWVQWYHADGQQPSCYGMTGSPSPSPLPKYSTDIAAAWELVEKLNLLGGEREMVRRHDYSKGYEVYEIIERPPQGMGHSEIIGRAKGAAHAICLAALKAVE